MYHFSEYEVFNTSIYTPEKYEFINNLPEKYEQIFLVGHSKCGLCLYNVTCYCQKEITLVTISTPFKGTIIADKETVEKKLKLQILKKIYNMIFSNHIVDRDIIPNSHFIQNLETATCKEQYRYWKIYLAVNVLKTCFCSF